MKSQTLSKYVAHAHDDIDSTAHSRAGSARRFDHQRNEFLKKAAHTFDTSKPNSSQTGDNSNIALWIALLFISGGGVTVLGISQKRKKAK